jgi:hypothetical protein
VARQGTQGNADDEGERHRVSLRQKGCIVLQGHTTISPSLGAIIPRAVSCAATVTRRRRAADDARGWRP